MTIELVLAMDIARLNSFGSTGVGAAAGGLCTGGFTLASAAAAADATLAAFLGLDTGAFFFFDHNQ